MSANPGENQNLVIGKNDNYLKIGSVYFATADILSEEQRERIKADYGFEFVAAKDVPTA